MKRLLMLFLIVTLINSKNKFKQKRRNKINGREKRWLNKYEEWIYKKDNLDFGNMDLYCEDGIGSGCYIYKKITKKEKRKFWIKLQRNIKNKNRKIRTN